MKKLTAFDLDGTLTREAAICKNHQLHNPGHIYRNAVLFDDLPPVVITGRTFEESSQCNEMLHDLYVELIGEYDTRIDPPALYLNPMTIKDRGEHGSFESKYPSAEWKAKIIGEFIRCSGGDPAGYDVSSQDHNTQVHFYDDDEYQLGAICYMLQSTFSLSIYEKCFKPWFVNHRDRYIYSWSNLPHIDALMYYKKLLRTREEKQ